MSTTTTHAASGAGEGVSDLTQAARDVLAERRRQVEAEGWSFGHDDEHDNGQLASAAACYALSSLQHEPGPATAIDHERNRFIAEAWPWNWTWWKQTERRRDLVKAGALILAEIDRLDRAEAATLTTEASR